MTKKEALDYLNPGGNPELHLQWRAGIIKKARKAPQKQTHNASPPGVTMHHLETSVMAIVETLANRKREQNEALYRKITWKLIPFLCLCYLAAYLDRINVGFTGLQMADQLQLSEAAFGLGAGLFFVGYILFEVPRRTDPAARRRQGVDCPAPRDHLGPAFRLYEIAGHYPQPVLHHPLFTWRSGSRLPARSTVLSDAVVRLLPSRPHHCAVHDRLYLPSAGGPAVRAGSWDILICATGCTAGNGCFAGRHSQRIVGRTHVLGAAEQLSTGQMAVRGRKTNALQTIWPDDAEASHSKHSFRDGFFNLKVWMLGGIDFSILLSAYAMGFWMPTLSRLPA